MALFGRLPMDSDPAGFPGFILSYIASNQLLEMMKMIRLSLLAVALLVGTSLYAQDAAFGLKAGLNLSKIDIDDPEATYEGKTGYHAGIFMSSRVGKIGFQPEVLLYTQSGEFETATVNNGKESFTYLTIPVMIKFYPLLGLNLQVGPQFGFLLDGERSGTNFFGDFKQDIKDQYDSNDFSVSAGAGYDFKFGLSLDARYNIGVKDINNAAAGEEAKSRVFLVSIGWNFLN